MDSQFEIVATGNVYQGEWMRRYLAEAEEVDYRELTPEEATSRRSTHGGSSA